MTKERTNISKAISNKEPYEGLTIYLMPKEDGTLHVIVCSFLDIRLATFANEVSQLIMKNEQITVSDLIDILGVGNVMPAMENENRIGYTKSDLEEAWQVVERPILTEQKTFDTLPVMYLIDFGAAHELCIKEEDTDAPIYVTFNKSGFTFVSASEATLKQLKKSLIDIFYNGHPDGDKLVSVHDLLYLPRFEDRYFHGFTSAIAASYYGWKCVDQISKPITEYCSRYYYTLPQPEVLEDRVNSDIFGGKIIAYVSSGVNKRYVRFTESVNSNGPAILDPVSLYGLKEFLINASKYQTTIPLRIIMKMVNGDEALYSNADCNDYDIDLADAANATFVYTLLNDDETCLSEGYSFICDLVPMKTIKEVSSRHASSKYVYVNTTHDVRISVDYDNESVKLIFTDCSECLRFLQLVRSRVLGCGLDLRIIDILSTAGITTDTIPKDQLIMYKKYGWRSEDVGEIKYVKTRTTGPLAIIPNYTVVFDEWTTLENN